MRSTHITTRAYIIMWLSFSVCAWFSAKLYAREARLPKFACYMWEGYTTTVISAHDELDASRSWPHDYQRWLARLRDRKASTRLNGGPRHVECAWTKPSTAAAVSPR